LIKDFSFFHGVKIVGDNLLASQGEFLHYEDVEFYGLTTPMIDPLEFEKTFISVIVDKASSLDLNHSEIARKVFRGVNDPVREWRAIRNVSKNQKRQPLSLEEAVLLAQEVSSDIAAPLTYRSVLGQN
jgi:hypothetical protein